MKGLMILLLYLPLLASAGEIALGMSTALSGPAQKLGKAMRLGVETCFREVNAAGGVHGQRLRLHVLDDGYEPLRAAENTRRLIDEYHVLALIGNVGTPTAIVTAPIANETHTLLFGALSGAQILRSEQYLPYVFNLRASYAEETSAMIFHLLDQGVRPREIAFFTQRDSYGDDGYLGAIKALQQRGFNQAYQLTHARYTRNSQNVETAVADILDSPVRPRAIIMVGSYTPAARFIQLIRRDLPDLEFMNVSFTGARALADALDKDSKGVLMTQVVPPFDSNLPIARRFRQALANYAPGHEPGYISFEGYIVAGLFVEGLKRAGQAPDTDRIIQALEGLHNLDLGLGIPVSFGPGRHQALHRVWPTRLQLGEFVPLDWSEPVADSVPGETR